MSYLPMDFSKYQIEYTLAIKNIQEYFLDNFNVTVYLMYGTLLGAIREKSFLIKDDDIDLAYLSQKSDVDGVKLEHIQICRKLEEDGLLIKNFNYKGQLHIYDPKKEMLVDLWTSWVGTKRDYNLVPLVNGFFHESSVIPFSEATLCDQKFTTPAKSDVLLDNFYGNWKEVNVGYKPKARRLWL